MGPDSSFEDHGFPPSSPEIKGFAFSKRADFSPLAWDLTPDDVDIISPTVWRGQKPRSRYSLDSKWQDGSNRLEPARGIEPPAFRHGVNRSLPVEVPFSQVSRMIPGPI